MLKATLHDAKRWREILDAISPLLEEAEFLVSPKGMQLRAMDTSRTAMVDLDLPQAFFDEYKCDAPARLCLNIKKILNLLEGVGSSETIEISYVEDEAKLVIYLSGEYKRVFSLATLATEKEAVQEPRATFSARAKVQTASLKKVIGDSQKIGDDISIETKADKITFRTKGLTGSVVSTFEKHEPTIIELSITHESEAQYSLELLGTIFRNASSISDVVNIEYSTNSVLKLDFPLPPGKLHFYLSPRWEED